MPEQGHRTIPAGATIAGLAAAVALVSLVAREVAANEAPMQYPTINGFVQDGQNVKMTIGGITPPCVVERRGEGYDWTPASFELGCCEETHWSETTDWPDYGPFTKHYFDVTDLCVPPGETEYRLEASCLDGGNCDAFFTVEDTGDECLSGGGQDGGDDGLDSEGDPYHRDPADCECGVAPGWSRDVSACGLALLLLATGLVALFISRRHVR